MTEKRLSIKCCALLLVLAATASFFTVLWEPFHDGGIAETEQVFPSGHHTLAACNNLTARGNFTRAKSGPPQAGPLLAGSKHGKQTLHFAAAASRPTAIASAAMPEARRWLLFRSLLI